MNTLTRWQRPVNPLLPLLGGLFELRGDLDQVFTPDLGWAPALDLFEDKDGYHVKAELPGLKRDEIQVSLVNGCLRISGERKREEKQRGNGMYRTERFYGKFERVIELPAPVDAAKVKAEYKDGVLSINLPKTEEVKPKQIQVSG